MTASAVALTLIAFTIVLRPAEVHWWKGGHLSDETLATLFVVRVPVLTFLLTWASGFGFIALMVVLALASVLAVVQYTPALRNARARRGAERRA